MQEYTSNPDADLNAPITHCEAAWGPNKCPNPVSMVLVTKRAKGYCPVCAPHAEAFGSPSQIIMVPIQQFEADREKYLYPRLGV